MIERPEFAERGPVIVGLHLGAFDLIMQSIFRQELKAMVLTIPDHREEDRSNMALTFDIRRDDGIMRMESIIL